MPTSSKRTDGWGGGKKKADRPAAHRKAGWGGARPGAGRPRGSGAGPSADARRNRVAIMLSDPDLKRLEQLARRRKLPVATLAHLLLRRALLSAR